MGAQSCGMMDGRARGGSATREHRHQRSHRMTQDEVAAEQASVDRLYARLDPLRTATATELAAVRRSGPVGTHQNRSERDSFATLHEQRLAQLEAVEDRLGLRRGGPPG